MYCMLWVKVLEVPSFLISHKNITVLLTRNGEQEFFLQKTGVFDEPADWSQYQCVRRKYFKYFDKNTK